MLGIVVQLLIPWLLLKYVQHQNLNALGLLPTRQHLLQFLYGLLLPVLYVCALQFSIAATVHNPYKLQPGYNFKALLNASWYLFKSIGFEDLLFRGALLYILMQRLGAVKAMILSSIAFGIYHWFSWGALGNPAAMLIIFCMTASAGYIFAMAFERTDSMYLGAGLHFGVDFANSVIFSQDKSLGQQLLIKTFATDPFKPATFIVILVIAIHFLGFPVIFFTWLKRMKKTAPDL